MVAGVLLAFWVMGFFLLFLLLSFLVFSSKSYTRNRLRGMIVLRESPMKVLWSCFFGVIFGVRSVVFGYISLNTRPLVVVAGFLRSGSIKLQLWWAILLEAWLARSREFSSWIRTWGPQSSFFRLWPVDIGGCGRRSLLGGHAPALVTTFSWRWWLLWFLFCVIHLFLLSQSVFVLLNFYWNIYWSIAR